MSGGASPSQAKQIGWVDEFGNLFPMGAWKPALRTHHDEHKAAWRPVYDFAPSELVRMNEQQRTDIAAERERCAMLCEAHAGMHGTGAWVALTAAADRIRGLIP